MTCQVNHGEDVQSRRGHDKMVYLARCEVTDPAEVVAIYAEFGGGCVRAERFRGCRRLDISGGQGRPFANHTTCTTARLQRQGLK